MEFWLERTIDRLNYSGQDAGQIVSLVWKMRYLKN